jgi:hypothetical protein
MMNRFSPEAHGDSRRSFSARIYRGPLVWIVVLLVGWLVLAEWQSWPALAASVFGLTH